MKLNLFICLLFISTISATAKDIYVNAAIGNDTAKVNDGATPLTALKSINMAVALAQNGDVILIEGINDKQSITYYESVVVNEDVPNIVFRGVNNPIISGKDNKSPENVGILILNNDASIENITFSDFLDRRINYMNIDGGAGIVLRRGNRDAIINNCTFQNCNYGIIAFENQSIRINGNKFTSIIQKSENEFDGGIGIYLWSKGAFIQDNYIGSQSGNTFANIDKYGILIGGNDKLVLADYTKIENNKFTNSKGTGLGIFNVEGIFNVNKNEFENNNISIELKGESIDAIISDNKFSGTSGKYELVSDERYPGDLLYSIWKSNGNIFKNAIFSVSEANTKDIIKLINGKRVLGIDENFMQKNKNETELLLK